MRDSDYERAAKSAAIALRKVVRTGQDSDGQEGSEESENPGNSAAERTISSDTVDLPSILGRSRTCPSTFAGSCAIQHTPRIESLRIEDWRLQLTAFTSFNRQSPICNLQVRIRCPGGFEPATSTVTASHASRLHHGHSAPTRTRTWNPELEAQDDFRFTIEAQQLPRPGLEPGTPR